MPRGGPRPGSGRPKGSGKKANTVLIAPKPSDDAVATVAALIGNGQMTPLEYMLGVINDPAADPARRDRLAMAAAPFCHERMADRVIGKKEVAQAKAASAGANSEWGDDLMPMPPPAEIRAN